MNTATEDLHPFRGLKNLLRLGLEFLPADEANERILTLEVELMIMKAELDKIKLWDERP